MRGGAAQIVAAARRKGWRIATAESCTGGMVAAAITAVAGSSAVFDGGIVSYANAAKRDLLGVPEPLILRHGAVSEPVAAAMAEGARARLGADVAVSVTGIAGPGGATADKPGGRVCFGRARADRPTRTETVDFGALGRAAVRRAAVRHALGLIGAALAD
ncbi:MAG: CinA family protein [Gemmobacter sp.]